MITLPTIATSIRAAANAGSKADIAGAGEMENATTGDLLTGVKDLPQDFLTALGNRLLTLAKQQDSVAQSTEKTAKNEDNVSPAGELNALLAALDKPDALNALLQPEKIKAAVKSADDKDTPDAATLSATDMQNMQALFAMLPASVAPTAAAPEPATESLASDNAGAKRSPFSALNLLTAQPAATQSAADAKPEHAQQTSAALASGSAQTGGASAQNDASALTLDSRFQQMLGDAGKQDDKTASASAQPDSSTLPPSAPLSSASVLNMPVTASASAATPSTPMLNAQLGSSEWQQALSQQIVMFTRNGQQNAELRLHPEDLGAIQISLKLDNDQAQLNMVSSHSHVRAALEAALPQLRSALAESGINLGQSNVSSDAFAQGQGFQGQQEARRDSQHGSFALSRENDDDITPVAVPAALQARVSGTGAVDIFA